MVRGLRPQCAPLLRTSPGYGSTIQGARTHCSLEHGHWDVSSADSRSTRPRAAKSSGRSWHDKYDAWTIHLVTARWQSRPHHAETKTKTKTKTPGTFPRIWLIPAQRLCPRAHNQCNSKRLRLQFGTPSVIPHPPMGNPKCQSP